MTAYTLRIEQKQEKCHLTCHLTKPGHRVFIAHRISLILGYAGKETIIDVAKGAVQESPYITDLSFFSSIFTYCNIVEAQMVGNVNARLIKTKADRPTTGKQLRIYSVKNMNFVHSRSQECAKSEIDLFSVPPTQISLEKGHWIDHQPVSSLADDGTITFLSPDTEDYVDLARTILVIRAKVTKADGTNLGANEKVRSFFMKTV
jgi:hypothetical protein